MRQRRHWMVALVLAVLAATVPVRLMAAQPVAPVPRLANGKPDLSGHWSNLHVTNMALRVVDPRTREPLKFARQGELIPGAKPSAAGTTPRSFDLPYTEWGLRKWRDYDPANKGDYAGNCLPYGMSRNINSPHGVQIVQNPDAIVLLFEQNTWFHWVPTSPSFKWPADLPPSWNGVSMGRWEGDTLIIETRNFNGYTKLDGAGHPHSKDMVMINTFTRTDANTMTHTVTVHDPKTYTQDWMSIRTWRLRPSSDVLMEYSCEENNLQNIVDGVIKVWTPDEDEEE